MTTKETILKRISENLPSHSPLPDVPHFEVTDNLKKMFIEKVEKAGGKVVSEKDIGSLIRTHYPDSKVIASPLKGVGFANKSLDVSSPRDLADVDLAVIEADFGVAENGALWIPEGAAGVRALPFIAQHLVVILSEKKIVATMHDAYATIGTTIPGFGVFIAGPSKTADIEQILVMGAHGPKSLMVVIW